jgi:hypothetical protein
MKRIATKLNLKEEQFITFSIVVLMTIGAFLSVILL